MAHRFTGATSGMSASSHSLSFPALLAQLRSLLPQDKHAALDAVSVSFNSAPSDKASVRAARRTLQPSSRHFFPVATTPPTASLLTTPPGAAAAV